MLVVMRMFLEPIRDGLIRTLETAGVDGVAVGTRRGVIIKHVYGQVVTMRVVRQSRFHRLTELVQLVSRNRSQADSVIIIGLITASCG